MGPFPGGAWPFFDANAARGGGIDSPAPARPARKRSEGAPMGTFGELSTAVQFFIAFLIVLALIVLSFWAIRRFGGIGLGAGAARGRQPRLGLVGAGAVDGRRAPRLVLR